MRRATVSLSLVLFIAAMLALIGPPSIGQTQDNPLAWCKRGCFSTEEDFMMRKGEPYDGNPYISDGDLLSFSGQVCARNADLLNAHYDGTPPADLGLDAVDIVDPGVREVDLGERLHDALILDLPLRLYCKADCRGLCAHCGQDLNAAACTCAEELVDPRWEALAHLKQ